MPKKRRNNGRGKMNQGNTANCVCTNCGRQVAKDKAIKRFAIRNIIEGTSKDDIQQMQMYPEMYLPKTYLKNYYCVSCACHARIVKVRSSSQRRIRKEEKKTEVETEEIEKH